MSSSMIERYTLAQMMAADKKRDGRKIKLRWNTPREVRRSLARVNNMVLNHELTAKEANSIFYSANLILDALKLDKG